MPPTTSLGAMTIFCETHPKYPNWAVLFTDPYLIGYWLTSWCVITWGIFEKVTVIDKCSKCSINLSFGGIQFSQWLSSHCLLMIHHLLSLDMKALPGRNHVNCDPWLQKTKLFFNVMSLKREVHKNCILHPRKDFFVPHYPQWPRHWLIVQ